MFFASVTVVTRYNRSATYFRVVNTSSYLLTASFSVSVVYVAAVHHVVKLEQHCHRGSRDFYQAADVITATVPFHLLTSHFQHLLHIPTNTHTLRLVSK